VKISFRSGTLKIVELPGASIVAGIRASEEFFAPLILTLPESDFPPIITNLSMIENNYLIEYVKATQLYAKVAVNNKITK
jgi:hypothetical protein